MIKTLSLCPTCYAKIPAEIQNQNGMVVMTKECPVHGPFSAVVEKDITHVSNFYSRGSMGRNNSIIIHVHGHCNMACPWCYYPPGHGRVRDFDYYDQVLDAYRGFSLLMSGGEPTLRPDFFEFTQEGAKKGWRMAAITNMLTMADDDFFMRALDSPLHEGGMLNFAMSMQHPKNYTKDIIEQKFKAMENLERHGKKAMCAMFSIQSLDELDFIREWYDATKKFYGMLRVRTMFGNWKDKGDPNKLFLSDLHRAFIAKFSDLNPRISTRVEKSNMYCLYLELDGGMDVSLSSAPTVENIDYHQCSRPVFMLGEDGKCYPVPICQIVEEGISRGWKDGHRLAEGGVACL